MGPQDLGLVRWAGDVDLCPDGKRLAWAETALDLERDEPVSRIVVSATAADGDRRNFTDGPHDFFPRWSPDGRYLAYLSASSGPPSLYLAPLDGGDPFKVDAPGAVRWMEWSPTGDRAVLVVNVGTRAGSGDDPKANNAARVVRGWFNRLDGEGWLDGRNHLFVLDVADRTVLQLISGEYDETQPTWSADGSEIAFVSDRSSRRDDRIGWGDLWVVPSGGGRPRRLVGGMGDLAFPTYSPDGRHVAFTGLPDPEAQAGRDTRVFVVAADGSGKPERVAPGLDRPAGFTLATRPLAWLSPDELAFMVVDAGTIGVHRARIGVRSARVVVAGDLQVGAIAVAGLRRRTTLAYTSAWVDSPAEVFCLDLRKPGQSAVQVSDTGAALRQAVDLLPAERMRTRVPDGPEIEYFVIRPQPTRGRARSRPPLFLQIHGGPNLYNPISPSFQWYQALAAAGYLVVLPNPRGSIGYGEDITMRSVGDWGGADFDDLLACVDDAIEQGLADPGRQFVGGYSYGGFMAAWTVGRTSRFSAAVVGAPIVDHISQFGSWDGGAFFADMMQSNPWDPSATLWSRSPLSLVANVTTPVFLYVNDGDLRCPPSQADEFYAALKWHGKDVEYVRYPGGSHLSFFVIAGAPSQNGDRIARALDFLGRHGRTRSGRDAAPRGRRRSPRQAVQTDDDR